MGVPYLYTLFTCRSTQCSLPHYKQSTSPTNGVQLLMSTIQQIVTNISLPVMRTYVCVVCMSIPPHAQASCYCLPPTACPLLPAPLLPAPYCLPPYCLPPTACPLLPAPYCLSPTACPLLPAPYCLPPTVCPLLPAPYCLPPTACPLNPKSMPSTCTNI